MPFSTPGFRIRILQLILRNPSLLTKKIQTLIVKKEIQQHMSKQTETSTKWQRRFRMATKGKTSGTQIVGETNLPKMKFRPDKRKLPPIR